MHVCAEEWRSDSFNFWSFDRSADELLGREFVMSVEAEESDAEQLLLEVLTRLQRIIGRRNDSSSIESFDRLLARHEAMHDRTKPLVVADLDHSRDVWQWTLRLDPQASFELQAAALFHDIERLRSEADARIEHLARDYQAFKNEHARAGGDLAYATLLDSGCDREKSRRVADLVATHEVRGSGDAATLGDADALSFLSFNSPGYFDYFGSEQGKKKVAYTLGRLRSESRRHLATFRLRSDVAAAVADVVREEQTVGRS